MKKILTRIETSVGHETYRLLIESEHSISSNNTTNTNYYFMRDALIVSVTITSSTASLSDGPFKKGFYNMLKFPILSTLLSEQSLDYGDINKTEE